MHKGVRSERPVHRDKIASLDRKHEQTQRATKKPVEAPKLDRNYERDTARKGTEDRHAEG